MFIKTRDFDHVEIKKEDILTFQNGVYAYENVKNFVLLKDKENPWMVYLQAVDAPDPRLVLLDPYLFFGDYAPVLPDCAYGLTKAEKRSDLCFFVVAVFPEEIQNTTVNLKSPVIINFEKKHGAQVILENKEYSVKTRLFSARETKSGEGTECW